MKYILVEKKHEFDFWFLGSDVYLNEESFNSVKEKFISDGLVLKEDYYNSGGGEVLESIYMVSNKYNYLTNENLTGVDNSNLHYAKIVYRDLFLINDEGIIIKGIRFTVDKELETISLEEIEIGDADYIIKNTNISFIDKMIENCEEKMLRCQERLDNLKNIKNLIK